MKTNSNFKGQLEGFPKEIVERMLDCQEEQTGERDLTVFEKRADGNGFYWRETEEGRDFWHNVIGKKDFDLFFEKYPNGYFDAGDTFFKRAYASLCRMQEAKDKAYGNSALEPLDIFAKHHPYGSRLDEKLARVKNASKLKKNDVADLMGGLMLICKSNGWDNFEDLID